MFRTILGSDQANSVKNTEINKQSHFKFWFNRKKYGAVSSLFSCTLDLRLIDVSLVPNKSVVGKFS